MNTSLREKCDLLIENKNTISGVYKWSSAGLNLSGAYLFTSSGKTADAAGLKAAEEILTAQTGAFSVFRGIIKVPLLCKMVLSGEPGAYLARTEELYGRLNKSKWFSSEFNALAAMVLADRAKDTEASDLVEKTLAMYQLMKEKHPWLTGHDDIVFAAILASTEADISRQAEEAERCFGILKNHFRGANAAQALSFVLALSGEAAPEKCGQVIRVYDGLKAAGHKYGSGYPLAALGMPAMLNMEPDDAVRAICEADTYLKEQKGFGDFSLGSENRRLYAAQMVLLDQRPAPDQSPDVVTGSALAAALAALEAAMIVIITTTTTTTLMSQS